MHEALSPVRLGGEAVAFTLVSSSADAARLPFAGSPTILVDGVGAFPGGPRTMELACRAYTTPAGRAGLPKVT